MEENNNFEITIQVVIYNVKDITTLNEIKQAIKNYIADKGDEKLKKFFSDDIHIFPYELYGQDYKAFKQKLKNDDELQKQIFAEISKCEKYLYEFQGFYDTIYRCISHDYDSAIMWHKNNELISNLCKLEGGIFSIRKDSIRQDFVPQFTTHLKNYLQKTTSPLLYCEQKKSYYNTIAVLQDVCIKYPNRYYDLEQFYGKLRLTIIGQRSFMLSYLSKQYHKKYFKKACICFIGAFIWFIITSTYINLPAGILGWININFEPTLGVKDEWLQYIVWITIKTPSIILAWIGLSYLRAADRHDQDAKELSNLYQYKSMITDPVTQDALMVALAPNYFGTKRNRRSDNNFMEKLLLKMIPTLNINAGGGSNNGNNGGQNGGQTT